jgi:uncharacterized membrane protein
VSALPLAPASAKQPRRLYIDWLRGVAVLVMILWHAVDAWHVREDRTTSAFVAVTFLAGWAAPLFLFLAGLSLPMAGLARMARGADRATAVRGLVIRGCQVLLLAHVFRLQSFLFNPNGRWSGLLKPDILNILALGMIAASLCWGRSTTTRARWFWLLLPTLLVVGVLTPLAPTWTWPTMLHPRLEAYIRPVGSMGVFSLFPAVGFLFAGTFVGALLAERPGTTEPSFFPSAMAWGLGLVACGVALSFVELPGVPTTWVKPLAVVTWRVGAMVVLLGLSWWGLGGRSLHPADPLMVFGRTSLFVYFVHVELVYGAFSFPLRNALTLPGALLAYVVLTILMYGAARWWLRRPAGPLIPAHMAAPRVLTRSTGHPR